MFGVAILGVIMFRRGNVCCGYLLCVHVCMYGSVCVYTCVYTCVWEGGSIATAMIKNLSFSF